MPDRQDTSAVLDALDAAREGSVPRGGWPLDVLLGAPTFQVAALAVFAGDGRESTRDLIAWLGRTRPEVLPFAEEARRPLDSTPSEWAAIHEATRSGSAMPEPALRALARSLADGSVDKPRAAAWLASSARRGLSDSAVEGLANALRDSGRIVDLRGPLRPVTLVRRYPTGTLSEKVALTLPPLVSLVRTMGVATPVLVARGLGFAGGTWDKLATIPSFAFFAPEDLARPLRRVGAAYSVPSTIAPADRELYALRAATGTIESVPLIAASIASKHLAVPVDDLLLESQYGEAGFLRDEADAREMARLVARAAAGSGMEVRLVTTDSRVATGSCIGPALEVWEALAVLGASSAAYASLDQRFIQAQRRITARAFGLLLGRSDEGRVAALESRALGDMRQGVALRAFRDILVEHGVPEPVTEALQSDPLTTLAPGSRATPIRVRRSGVVRRIDRRTLGRVVNVGLGAATNPFLATEGASAGIQLHVATGDVVDRGDSVCTLYAPSDAPRDALAEQVLQTFEVST